MQVFSDISSNPLLFDWSYQIVLACTLVSITSDESMGRPLHKCITHVAGYRKCPVRQRVDEKSSGRLDDRSAGHSTGSELQHLHLYRGHNGGIGQ